MWFMILIAGTAIAFGFTILREMLWYTSYFCLLLVIVIPFVYIGSLVVMDTKGNGPDLSRPIMCYHK